jgi:methylase of polypeptide subunit release factors
MMQEEFESKLLSIPQNVLNTEERDGRNPLGWRGQFTPELVQAYLEILPHDSPTIYDPFCGSGTVLMESARKGFEAIGLEVNPAACILSRSYLCTSMADVEREELCNQISSWTESVCNQVGDSAWDESIGAVAERVIDSGDSVKDYLKSTMLISSKIRGNSSTKLRRGSNRICKLIRELPHSNKRVEVLLCDARFSSIESDSVDFVFTSPPYINVFNYHQQYRAEVESLGHEVLVNAKSEIGSNRKHRSNRLKTVVQYCLDMEIILNELHRVMKSDGIAVFVVGRESNVRKTAFLNSELIEKIATQCCNFEILGIRERYYVNRFGEKIYEDILHLKLIDQAPLDNQITTLSIAIEALTKALGEATEDDIIMDLEEVIRLADEILPSPPLA